MTKDSPGLSETQKGILFAVLAQCVWGAMAMYFGYIRYIPSLEVLANRALWSIPVALTIVGALGLFSNVVRIMKNPSTLAIMALTSLLVGVNWGVYIWSIQHHHAFDVSFGYFINPLMNVAMGYFFLNERFTRLQVLALALASLAVLLQMIMLGTIPWNGLVLATTFSLYGFFRKIVNVGAIEGFLIEILISAPFFLILEFSILRSGDGFLFSSAPDTIKLAVNGLFTSAGLIAYALSVRRLPYSLAGILQYISPSLIFLGALFVFQEPLDFWRFVSFVIVWVALACFSLSAFMKSRHAR